MQAPFSPQTELQNRQVESMPMPKISGGGIKPGKGGDYRQTAEALTASLTGLVQPAKQAER
ncbi:hypothetical protein EYF80_031004 [Liparis tanakae]|uniref:Uncharacterized protein n=1 Tax=Liparis tanakae TaxID=230148 RepID=A0A4Z2GZ51_9TELE|nr:hypothetical protein EYF80_031004 [Liparis tanakae]